MERSVQASDTVIEQGVHSPEGRGMRNSGEADNSLEGAILQFEDPAPFEIVNAEGNSRIFLLCEHAGRAVPKLLGNLGLTDAELSRHIAYDIGAEQVSRYLSRLLDAPLVVQPYSRLVIDCNRPIEAADSIPVVSDTTIIPANANLPQTHRQARQNEIHSEFHSVVKSQLDKHVAAHRTILITIHSFTRRLLADGIERPWELGLLFNRDDRFSRRLMASVQSHFPAVIAAFNEPYVADDETDYAIPIHGERRGIENVLLEIRNDLIADETGQKAWAELLADAISDAIADGESETNAA